MSFVKRISIFVMSILLGITLITPASIGAETISDTDRIKQNFRNYLVGDVTTNNLPISKNKMNSIASAAKRAHEDFEITDISIFKGVYLKNSTDIEERTVAQLSQALQDTSVRLLNLSVAYSTNFIGNQYYQDEEIKNIIILGIKHLYDEYYSKHDTGYYGNWYNWEIGVPLNITKVMLLMEDEMSIELPGYIDNIISSMDQYLRNGIDGDVDLAYRNYTGANLFDITFNRIIHGAIQKNEARIDKSFSDMMTVFDSIDPDNIVNGVTDGYYEDGSILQHSTVAYTGSYGAVLLQRIGQTVTVLTGTRWQDDKLLDTVQLWIYTAFSPIIYEGYMMEIVKGRAVSRTATGYASSRSIIESFVELSKGLEGDEKTRLQSHIKYITTRQKEKFNASSFVSLQNILAYDEIMNDATIIPKNALETRAHYAFNLMDKTVHLRDEFAFSISKSSNRVSKYEYMSGENMRSWFQGDGMFSLYLAGQDHNKSYGIDFYTTVDHYKLPGTTTPNEIRQTMRELYGAQFFEDLDYDMYSSSVKQNQYVYFPLGTNNYSGGVSHNKYGISSMQLGDEPSYQAVENGELPKEFVTYRNADANKSWFMFDDQIVALGSNITDKFGRDLTTTYDNRMYDKDDVVSLLKSDNNKGLTVHSGKQNSYISYVYLDDNEVNAKIEHRSQDRNYIREANPVGTVIDKQYSTLTVDHDGNDVSTYAYVMLPNSNEKTRDTFMNTNPIKILENSSNIHAVRHEELELTGYASFSGEEQRIEDLTTKSKMIIMRDGTSFTITDPTNEQEIVEFSLDGLYSVTHDRVKTSIKNGVTTFTLDTKSLNGMGIEFDLNDYEPFELNDGNVTVIVDKGQLPKGTMLSATLTEKNIDGYIHVLGYELKFIFEGNEILPKGDLKVTFTSDEILDSHVLFGTLDSKLEKFEFTSNGEYATFTIKEPGYFGFYKEINDVDPITPIDPPMDNNSGNGNLPNTGVATQWLASISFLVLGFVTLIFRKSAIKHSNLSEK